MKRVNTIYSFLGLFMLASCQVEVLPTVNDKTSNEVCVEFIADKPNTKTEMVIVDKTATFDWTEKDKTTANWFHVFNNGNEATSVTQSMSGSKMKLKATFSSLSGNDFTGYMNGVVSSAQSVSNDTYDENSDVLAARATASSSEIAAGVPFYFKRLTSISIMTLDGLTNGDVIDKIVLISDKAIAGEYNGTNWVSTSNVIQLSCSETVADNKVSVCFMTIPVTDAQFQVLAYVGSTKAYGKLFSKTISLDESAVTPYKVSMNSIPVSGTITITASSIENFAGSYAVRTWTDGAFSGKCFAYRAGSSSPYLMQFNSTPYVYNTIAIPGRIKSINIVKGGSTDKTWSVYTSATPITSAVASKQVGEDQTIGTSGYTWEIPSENNDSFFYIKKGSGSTQISSFNIVYEPIGTSSGGGSTPQDPTVGDGTVLKYTLEAVSNGSNTGYASNYDVKIDGITWSAPGNQSSSGYWRIGGKDLSNVDRFIFSKSKMPYEVDKVVVNTNGKNNASLTVNSVRLDVYSTAAKAETGGTGDVASLSPSATPSWPVSSETNFEFVKADSKSWNGMFYRLTFNLSNSNTSRNYGVDLNSIQFYY